MSVDDHGIETLKKSAEEINAGDKSEYQHRVRVTRITSSELPDGASTEAKQDNQIVLETASNAKLDAANTNLVTIQGKQDAQTTQLTAINANTDGLEALITSTNTKLDSVLAEEATEAKQDTIIARLDAILAEESTEAKQDTIIARLDSVLAEESTEAKQDTQISLATDANTKLDTVITRLDSVLAEESTEAKQDSQITLATSTNTKLDTLISQTDAVEGSLSTLVTQTDTIEPRLGDLTETAPATDTASSGLNGRLQRVAQNLTTANSNLSTLITQTDTLESLITTSNTSLATIITQTDAVEASLAAIDAGTPVALGQTTMSASQPVVLASDQAGINTFQDKSGSGTITALNGAVTATTNGAATVTFDITGTFTASVGIQGTSNAGVTWTSILGMVPLGIITAGINNVGGLIVPCGGYSQVRLIATAFTSGTVSVTWNSSAGAGNVTQVVQLTAGNLIASVNVRDGAGTAIGSNYGAASAALRVAAQLGDASGNVTPAGDVASRSIFTKISDGTSVAEVLPASLAPVATDTAIVVAVSPNSSVHTGSAPAFASVGVTSAQALAANANRKGLVLTNTSNKTISLGIGANAAVLNSGITLFPGGVWVMDQYTFITAAINAIAGGVGSNLAIQEFTQ